MSNHSDKSFQTYRDYASNLRTWFISYGVGLPAFVFSNSTIRTNLLNKALLDCALLIILIGIGSQILLSLINKFTNWHCYRFTEDDEYKSQNPCKACFYEWLSNQIWIDQLLDIATLISYIIATILVYKNI